MIEHNSLVVLLGLTVSVDDFLCLRSMGQRVHVFVDDLLLQNNGHEGEVNVGWVFLKLFDQKNAPTANKLARLRCLVFHLLTFY